jgi:WD40 repeat protein
MKWDGRAFIPIGMVIAGMLTFATASTVRRSNFYNRPSRDDSFLTVPVNAQLSSVAVSPDGRLVATAGNDSLVRLWNSETGHEIRTLRGHTSRSILAVAFSPDGQWVASGSRDRTARMWRVPIGGDARVIARHRDRVMALDFSTEGMLLATGSRDRSVKVWDALRARELATVRQDFGFVPSIAFHDDLVAFGDWYGSMWLWNYRTRELDRLGHFGRAIYGVAFAADGRQVASGGYDGQIRVWDVGTRSRVNRFAGHTRRILSVAFHPCRPLLASAGEDRTIRLWNLATRSHERTLVGHAQSVNGLAFSPDGQWLVSASRDQTFKVWRIGPCEFTPVSG